MHGAQDGQRTRVHMMVQKGESNCNRNANLRNAPNVGTDARPFLRIRQTQNAGADAHPRIVWDCMSAFGNGTDGVHSHNSSVQKKQPDALHRAVSKKIF